MKDIVLDPVDAPLASVDTDGDSDDPSVGGDLPVRQTGENVNASRRSLTALMDDFRDGGSDSLEDLVTHFDKQITECLKDYKESTSAIAPVQIRSQEEAMNDSQIWWTLTGNFGNILPMDWSKTRTRKLQLAALGVLPKEDGENSGGDDRNEQSDGPSEDDEELRDVMDLHKMVVSSLSNGDENDISAQTADQVIEEIDEIMQQSNISELTGSSDVTTDSVDSMYAPKKRDAAAVGDAYSGDKLLLHSCVSELSASTYDCKALEKLPYEKLSLFHSELETLIQLYNESLVQELALRDEFEFEKEQKNTFISLLLSIQHKRRQWYQECRRKLSKSSPEAFSPRDKAVLPQYFTACIPYDEKQGIPDNASFQALIKILTAIDEDSPMVPHLLTDYILNVFCPRNLIGT